MHEMLCKPHRLFSHRLSEKLINDGTFALKSFCMVCSQVWFVAINIILETCFYQYGYYQAIYILQYWKYRYTRNTVVWNSLLDKGNDGVQRTTHAKDFACAVVQNRHIVNAVLRLALSLRYVAQLQHVTTVRCKRRRYTTL